VQSGTTFLEKFFFGDAALHHEIIFIWKYFNKRLQENYNFCDEFWILLQQWFIDLLFDLEEPIDRICFTKRDQQKENKLTI